MKVSAFALAVSLASIAIPATADAAIYIITYRGTVSSGFDYTGEFGAANTFLSGNSFEAIYRLDTSAAGAFVTMDATLDDIYGGSRNAVSSPVSATISIDGGAAIAFSGAYLGEAYQLDALPYPYGYDEVSHKAEDAFSNGIIETDNYIYNGVKSHINQIVNSSDYTHSLDYTIQNGDLGFGYLQISTFNYLTNKYEHNAFMGLTSNSVTIAPLAAVPEPTSWALMIAGFGIVGSAMRRHRSLRVALA